LKKKIRKESVTKNRPADDQKNENKKPKKGLRGWISRKIGISMGLRLSVSYIKMVTDVFLSCLILMIIIYVLFNMFIFVYDAKLIADELRKTEKLNESIYNLVIQRGTAIALEDMSGVSLINTFGDYLMPHEKIPVWFSQKDGSIYIMTKNYLFRQDGNYRIIVFRDITKKLMEMGVLFVSAVIMGGISLLTIFFKGISTTKNSLKPLAEMTKMTGEIRAQNLNLRLNVTNAKDELKELVITFNSMMDRIETAYNKQNQFVSDASHELRTPISVIQGYARMLERWGKEDPEVLQESIEAIRNEAENMKELVEKLLFIARNDKDTLTLTKENFSLSEMMEELVKETRMVDGRHVINSSIEQGIKVFGDRNLIKQAMRIFVDNAQKYTEEGSSIDISLRRDENKAIMVVKDQGCGIPEKDLSGIFDRFYRTDESRDRNRGGHGLGLSIAKIIVLRHGGKIHVKSKQGESSEFSVILNINLSDKNDLS
jgi:two-component system sensor histidine kinase ArlS